MSTSHPHFCFEFEGVHLSPMCQRSILRRVFFWITLPSPVSDRSCLVAYSIVCGMVLGCWIQPDFFFNVLFNPEVRSILVFCRLDEPLPFHLGDSFLLPSCLVETFPCINTLCSASCALYSNVLAFHKLEKLSPMSVSVLLFYISLRCQKFSS